MLLWLLNLNFAASAGTPPPIAANSTLNDAMLRALSLAGFTGTLNDGLMQWLGGLGHTGTLNGRWNQFLIAAGHTNGTINDRLLAYYISQGADSRSTLNDAARYAWINNPPAT